MSGSNENTFAEQLHDHFFEKLNTAPTRGCNTIDLVLTNIAKSKYVMFSLPLKQNFSLFAEHVIVFELLILQNEQPKVLRIVYFYRQGDFVGLQTSLVECPSLESLITTNDNINHDWQSWKNAFLEKVAQHIPTTGVKGRHLYLTLIEI